MAKIQGADLMVFAKKNDKLQSIAFATSHTLDVTMNTKDTSTKDNGNGIWQNSEAGLMSWTMQTDNLMSDVSENGLSMNDLFEMMLTRKPVEVAFALQGNNTDYSAKLDEEFTAPTEGWTPDTKNQYHGKALITSLNVTAQNGETAKASATFAGCGNLMKMGGGILSPAAAASLSAKGTPVTTTETATIKK